MTMREKLLGAPLNLAANRAVARIGARLWTIDSNRVWERVRDSVCDVVFARLTSGGES
jgi:hypothetical protein